MPLGRRAPHRMGPAAQLPAIARNARRTIETPHEAPAAMNHIRRTFSNTQGQTMTEYALILALLVTLTLAFLPTFGASVLNLFNELATVFGGS
jgi:Flp pilus assembly pilin Flp